MTYRGYSQERIGAAFDDRWNLLGIPVDPGMFVAGLFFGLVHMLNPFDPFAGRWAIAPLWGITTMGSGLMFSIVRQASGSMIPPILLHALPDILGACTRDTGQGSVLASATMIAAYAIIFFLSVIVARRKTRGMASGAAKAVTR